MHTASGRQSALADQVAALAGRVETAGQAAASAAGELVAGAAIADYAMAWSLSMRMLSQSLGGTRRQRRRRRIGLRDDRSRGDAGGATMSAESFAGIEVPEGEPGALNDAAGQFGAVASSLSGVAGDLRGLPASMAWSGPASVAYAGSCLTNSGAMDYRRHAFGQAEHAARAYAGKLKDAKQRAREAIRDARDAQNRIDAGRAGRSPTPRTARRPPRTPRRSPSQQVAIATAAATPAPEYEAMRTQAQSDQAAAAADDEARARRELARAQDDLERRQEARPRGDGRRPRRRAQPPRPRSARASASSPAYAAAGAPGAGQRAAAACNWWDTTNEGSKVFDEDAFLAQLLFFHPKNDTIGRYKWWGDRALDVGFEYGDDAVTAYGFRVSHSAFSTMRVWDVAREPHVRLRPERDLGRGRADSASSRPVTVIDADTLAQERDDPQGRQGDPVRRRGDRDRQRRLGPVARGLEQPEPHDDRSRRPLGGRRRLRRRRLDRRRGDRHDDLPRASAPAPGW